MQLAGLDRRIQAGQAAALAQHADVHALQQRILDLLPATSCTQEPGIPSFWQRMVGWPDTPRFALALAGLAVFALVMIMPQSQPPGVSPRAAAQYEAWSWYDITGQDLPASNDSTALTMTDLIDLEVDQDGG